MSERHGPETQALEPAQIPGTSGSLRSRRRFFTHRQVRQPIARRRGFLVMDRKSLSSSSVGSNRVTECRADLGQQTNSNGHPRRTVRDVTSGSLPLASGRFSLIVVSERAPINGVVQSYRRHAFKRNVAFQLPETIFHFEEALNQLLVLT